jgi:hypothetical protein
MAMRRMNKLSADLKADILKAAHDAEHRQNKQNKKVIKRCRYFILKFPNGAESLLRSSNGWAGLTDYVKYFKDEYGDNIMFVAISKSEAFRFFLKGKLFPC